MQISAVVAMSENRVIGVDNQLPWRLPADLQHFKAVTMGKPVLMGRKTHESIGRLLPGRENVIITRNKDFEVAGATVVHSIDRALAAVAQAEEVMVIGGSMLFSEMMPQLQRIYLTVVHVELEGDSYFPEFRFEGWRKLSSERHEADEVNSYAYSFELWERES